MNRISALPLRVRSDAIGDNEQESEELDITQVRLPDRTIEPRGDSGHNNTTPAISTTVTAQNDTQVNAATGWESIDPYWSSASNLRQLESFVSDVENAGTPQEPAHRVLPIQFPQQPDTDFLSSGQDDMDPTANPNTRGQRDSASAPQGHDAVEDKARAFGNETAQQLELRLSNEFTPIKETDWDTVIYIGPPPHQHSQSLEEYTFIKQHFERPYLMRSQTLRDSGSAEFAKRLGPMSARAMRKLRRLGVHLKLPSDGQPQYWIDLRPEQNDDEAAQTVSDLTCTPGILKWHILGAKKSIDPMIICGKDSMNIPTDVPRGVELPENFFSANVSTLRNKDEGVTIDLQNKNDLEPDYSLLRHHSAIERVLQALAGHTPKLNSAPKVWTFFAVARLLDCAQCPRICDEIYSWLFNGYNSEFIEVNPEVCYRIAMGIHSKMLLRVTFSMLVGEKAAYQVLQQLGKEPARSPTISKSRPLCHLDDDEVNRIDHAARSLSHRVWQILSDLLDRPVTWMAKSVEIYKLLALEAQDAVGQRQVEATWTTLRDYVRSEIINALAQNLKTVEVLENKPFWPADSGKLRTFSAEAVEEYNRLPLPQRLFSQISWNFIKSYSIYRDRSAFAITGWKQWDGLEEIVSIAALSEHITVGASQLTGTALESNMTTLNSQITLGNVRYNGVVAPAMGNGAYEVRWDAVYSAARRNLSAVSRVLSIAECDGIRQVIAQRERQHQHEVAWYDARFAPDIISERPGASDQFSTMGPKSQKAKSADYYYTSSHISTTDLWSQLSNTLGSKIETDILRPGYLKDASSMEADIRVDSVETLLCLDEDEFKFLPLWADGYNDGSGGVYTEAIPGAIDEDFQGGKRGLDIDEGLEGLDDVEMGESFSVIDSREAESTVMGASHAATAGLSHESVMSMDE